MRRACIIAFFLLTFVLCGAHGQRVGVVFSGGGAKGLYHIGILKALEENHIPVDYIAGTSMGAIIAGLYAIGYTPQEMAQLFLSDQVRLWMSGQIESQYAFYFNRMQPRQDMLTLDLDFEAEHSIAVLPTNLVPSTQLDMAFNEIFATATAATGGDFDRLLVPFRCVASDVYNKREVVYRGGDLGRAIRASMTIPMVFRPLRADSVLLYDGGIYNNFPWEPLQEDFQPDIFIGGKCIKSLPNPDQTSVVEQIEAITMMHTDFELPEGRGILIERVFDEVGVLDFSKAQQIMDAGYADAMAQMEQIRARITRRRPAEELAGRRLAFRSALPELVFDNYRVQGLTDEQARYVQRLLGLDRHRDHSFSFQQFKSAYFKILSEGEILGDYPRMTYNDSTGFFTVDLLLRNRPSLRVKLGGNISSTALNQAYFGAEYKMLAHGSHAFGFDANFSGAYTSVRGGWRADFYLRSPVYAELKYNYNNYNLKKAPHWSRFSRYGYHGYRDRYFSGALGFPLGLSSVLQLRFNMGSDWFDYYDRDYITQQYGSSDRTLFGYYGAQIEASTYKLNYTLFPTRGVAQSLSAIFVDGRESFLAGENYKVPSHVVEQGVAYPFDPKTPRRWVGARYTRQQYYPMGRWLSWGYLVEAAYTTIPDFHTGHATNFVSPGFTPTPYSQSLYMDKFRSRMYLGMGVMPTVEFNDNFYLKTGGYLFLSDKLLEGGFRMKDKVRYILDFALVYQSPIGPASLTVTNFDESTRSWFVVFNFGYTLFNKRGVFY